MCAKPYLFVVSGNPSRRHLLCATTYSPGSHHRSVALATLGVRLELAALFGLNREDCLP